MLGNCKQGKDMRKIKRISYVALLAVILLICVSLFSACGGGGDVIVSVVSGDGSVSKYKFKQDQEIVIETRDTDFLKIEGYFYDSAFTRPFEGGKAKKDLTLYAKVTEYCRLTFFFTGSTDISPKFVQKGTAAELPRPELSGNTFEGWFADVNFTVPVTEDTAINGNMQLYGKWHKDVLNVTLDYGEFADRQIINVNYGCAAQLSFEDAGNYKFGGWYTDAEFRESFDAESPIVSDITLYAEYIAPVTLKVDNLKGSARTLQIKYGDVPDLSEFETFGLYYFDGWYFADDSDKAFDASAPVYEDAAVCARWKEPVKVSFYTFYGTDPTVVELKYGERAEPAEPPEYAGHLFSGWYKNVNTTILYDFNEPVYRDMRLYSGWHKLYTVTFLAQNGEDAFSIEVKEGDAVPVPETPKKDYNEFLGWYTQDNKLYDFDTEITRDITLQAKWKDLLVQEFKEKYLYIQEDVPMITITTEGNQPIVSKEVYINAVMDVTSTVAEYNNSGIVLEIRGRGNSSWGMEKKSYRLKLDSKKTNLVGFTGSKHYALIANHMDKSLIRNYLAYLSGRICDSMWAPDTRFVEVTLNGEYLGLYMLTETIKVEEGRIDLSGIPENEFDTGFLVEQTVRDRLGTALEETEFTFENTAGDFFVYAGNFWWEVKYPEKPDYPAAVWTGIVDYIRGYLDTALKGIYQNRIDYIELDSFADFWLIQELFANWDCFQLSVYMTKNQGGKLDMGPVWDFDNSCNNISYVITEPDRPYAAERAKIFQGLLGNAEFVAFYKERAKFLSSTYWKYIVDSIYQVMYSIEKAAYRNFEKWDITENIMANPPHILEIDSYLGQVQYLKEWLDARVKCFQTNYGIFGS